MNEYLCNDVCRSKHKVTQKAYARLDTVVDCASMLSLNATIMRSYFPMREE